MSEIVWPLHIRFYLLFYPSDVDIIYGSSPALEGLPSRAQSACGRRGREEGSCGIDQSVRTARDTSFLSLLPSWLPSVPHTRNGSRALSPDILPGILNKVNKVTHDSKLQFLLELNCEFSIFTCFNASKGIIFHLLLNWICEMEADMAIYMYLGSHIPI